MADERTFVLSADTLIGWLLKHFEKSHMPPWLLGVVAYLAQFRGKEVEVTVRVAKKGKPR